MRNGRANGMCLITKDSCVCVFIFFSFGYVGYIKKSPFFSQRRCCVLTHVSIFYTHTHTLLLK